MNNTKVLSVERVGVDYSVSRSLFFNTKKTALKDVSFELFQGESLGVIGRNGAGKSTLLKLLAGVIEPDRGVIKGKDNLTISLLALQAGFDMHLSGYDNIYLSGLLLGFSQKEVEQRVEEIIAFSELNESIHHPVKTYSTGMRARLGFSIAYRLNADILLIDEIIGVGDIDFREKSISAMKERIRSEQTVIFVSHHGPTIRNLCKRAVWIEDGETKMIGDSKLVIAEYEKYLLTDN